MKRALFALPLLALVLPAQAQGSFCNGLAQLVVAAPDYPGLGSAIPHRQGGRAAAASPLFGVG